MHQQQARLYFILIHETIDVDTYSLLNLCTSFSIYEIRERETAESFLCQFRMKVNAKQKLLMAQFEVPRVCLPLFTWGARATRSANKKAGIGPPGELLVGTRLRQCLLALSCSSARLIALLASSLLRPNFCSVLPMLSPFANPARMAARVMFGFEAPRLCASLVAATY